MTTTSHRTPWLALTSPPRPETIECAMVNLRRWLAENPGEHEERRAIVLTAHAALDRVRRELADIQWMVDQAINFTPMDP